MVRKKIPKKIVDEVLCKAKHKCSICANDAVIIHHIDNDPSNNTIENLIVLCPNHHSLVHSKSKLTKQFSLKELKKYYFQPR